MAGPGAHALFAIGSTALVSLALFGAFCARSYIARVDFLHPWIFINLLSGALRPYAFAALATKSVGEAANESVKKIVDGSALPVFEKCILIYLRASLYELLAPDAWLSSFH